MIAEPGNAKAPNESGAEDKPSAPLPLQPDQCASPRYASRTR
jgi:hypothetical protein